MKNTIINALLIVSLCAHQAGAANPAVGIHIIEDVSGAELQKHGIKAADFDDMQILADTLFATRRAASIGYDVVDEDGQDNSPLQFSITPFEKTIPTRPAFKGMTVRDKMLALKEFEARSAEFRKDNDEWRARILDGARSWLDDCVDHRLQVEADFLARLKANQNRDFRRSDIIGAVQKANECLAGASAKFLVLNSDLNHQPGPGARDQKVRSLGIADLSADIVLIIVNTSREPDKSPLLKDLPNRTLHADNLQAAAALIAVELTAGSKSLPTKPSE
ncbi:MAG: hypothetical protein H7A55_08150 [Verrucomicrobiaceae bacterium]|nr:hypothetical protein [Verrucomicrobiaceae bacterium]